MNFAKVFLATATLMVASISPSLAGSTNPTDRTSPPSNDPKVEIVGADYLGTGCPDGSARMRISDDGQELRIVLNKFSALGNGSALDQRKQCSLSISLKVPQGRQISIYTAKYTGYVSPNTTGKLRANYYLVGLGYPEDNIFENQLKGETDYTVTHDPVTAIWSKCNDSGVIMAVDISMVAKGDGIASVDNFNFGHDALIYYVKSRSCQ
jgi:Domain of unknown function (DUF4360)